MSSTQQLFFHRTIACILQIALHFMHKFLLDIGNTPTQLAINPSIQLFTINAHHFVKNSWFNIREHIALQKLKYTALNQATPINLRAVVILFMARQNVNYHHLMGLLIQLSKAHGANMLIPALNMRSFIQKLYKTFR